MHSALRCPPVRTSCMRGCHSARKTRSPLRRKRLQERFLTYSWEWIMRHALDAFHCICNERWTQRKTTDFFRVPVSWEPSQMAANRMWFANLSSRRCHKNEDSKDLLQFEICSANMFLVSLLSYESSLSLFMEFHSNCGYSPDIISLFSSQRNVRKHIRNS